MLARMKDVGVEKTYVLLLEYKLVQPLWKLVQMFFKKLETELPHDLAILLWAYVKKETPAPLCL
jgi:hypothetical protein